MFDIHLAKTVINLDICNSNYGSSSFSSGRYLNMQKTNLCVRKDEKLCVHTIFIML